MTALLGLAACGSTSTPGAPADAGVTDLGAVAPPVTDVDGGEHPLLVDGGYATPDGAILPASRFITRVVSFDAGPCAGFGKNRMPDVVFGPPVGGGDTEGSTDVVSLGNRGEIIVSFEPNAIADGPGVDLLVFENPFYIGGNPANAFAEPGEVSVSDDGVTWSTFTCEANAAPWRGCAGVHPVYSTPTNGISPLDPQKAGGDGYDLHDLGVARARFVRVRDKTNEACPSAPPLPTTNGFDLDAMAVVNASQP